MGSIGSRIRSVLCGFGLLIPQLALASNYTYQPQFRYEPRYDDDDYHGTSDGDSGPIVSLDLDAKSELNSSFRMAVREDRVDDVLKDLREGADVNSHSSTGVTALMYASRACANPMVEQLLKAGATVNAVDSDGRPALVYAVKESCLETVRLLLRAPGLHWEHRDHGGLDALDYARDMALTDVDGPAIDIMTTLRRRSRDKR